MLANAASGSPKNITPKRLSTTSKPRPASGWTNAEAVALALVGTVHHLLMTTWSSAAPDPREQVRRLIPALTGSDGY
ncbi:hypothetical protein ACWGI0_26690 [Streptomyces sp. NPDC054802]